MRQGDVVLGGKVHPKARRGVTGYVAVAPTDSTRLYASGTVTRFNGAHNIDSTGLASKERNDTTQGELGAGWGHASRHLRVEALAGLGYGKTAYSYFDSDSDSEPNCVGPTCSTWVDGRASFVRGFAQGQVAFNSQRNRNHVGYTGGGGVRLATDHYRYSELVSEESYRATRLVSIEPFVVQRLDLHYVSLEYTLHFPLLLRTGHITLDNVDPQTGESARAAHRLVQSPMPSIYFGLLFNLDELWRVRTPGP